MDSRRSTSTSSSYSSDGGVRLEWPDFELPALPDFDGVVSGYEHSLEPFLHPGQFSFQFLSGESLSTYSRMWGGLRRTTYGQHQTQRMG